MRIIFMGTPEFALPSLEYLLLTHHQVVAVYTQPDKPSGRGRTLVPPPVKRVALQHGLPAIQPASMKKAEVVTQIACFKPDAIVVAAFGQILPQSILDIPRYGCINVHPSLLPKFRGPSPVAAAILAGDEFTGVSIMQMDAGMDTGPVFTRAQIPINLHDTTGILTDKLARMGARLLVDVLVSWFRGELKPQPQSEVGATYSSTVKKEDGEINWSLLALDIWRRVRAFQPWPGCFTRWRGKQFKIVEAEPLKQRKSVKAGKVIALANEGAAFGVGTGSGILKVTTVQLEGKRVMSAGDFLRGQREFIGTTLPSN